MSSDRQKKIIRLSYKVSTLFVHMYCCWQSSKGTCNYLEKKHRFNHCFSNFYWVEFYVAVGFSDSIEPLSTSSIQKCVTAVVKKGVNFNDFLADRCELIIASCKSVQVSFGPTWDLKLSRCGPKLFGFGNLGNDESIDALFSAYVCIRPFADNFSARNYFLYY
jgi:hypothetical protein